MRNLKSKIGSFNFPQWFHTYSLAIRMNVYSIVSLQGGLLLRLVFLFLLNQGTNRHGLA